VPAGRSARVPPGNAVHHRSTCSTSSSGSGGGLQRDPHAVAHHAQLHWPVKSNRRRTARVVVSSSSGDRSRAAAVGSSSPHLLSGGLYVLGSYNCFGEGWASGRDDRPGTMAVRGARGHRGIVTSFQRVLVGLQRNPTGLAALRRAAETATQHAARLYVVDARRTRLPGYTGGRPPLVAPAAGPDGGQQRALDAFAAAMGAPPDGVEVHVATVTGALGPQLVELADREDDLLVVAGSSPGRPFERVAGSSLVRCCTRRARCPVLVVPPHELARDIGTGRWRGVS